MIYPTSRRVVPNDANDKGRSDTDGAEDNVPKVELLIAEGMTVLDAHHDAGDVQTEGKQVPCNDACE